MKDVFNHFFRDLDFFSKSDPMCVVFIQPFGGHHWKEFARTECIQNNLNPNWARKVWPL